MIKPVIESFTCDGNAEHACVGKVRQTQTAGLVLLAEDHVLFGAVERGCWTNCADGIPSQGEHPTHAGATHQCLASGSRGCRAQPSGSERSRRPSTARADRTGAAPSAPSSAMAGAHRPRFDTCLLSRTPALAAAASGDNVKSVGHVQPHLVVGDVQARRHRFPLVETNNNLHHAPGRQTGPKTRDADGDGPPVRLRPPFGPSPSAQSHPDCRWSLTLIVAAHALQCGYWMYLGRSTNRGGGGFGQTENRTLPSFTSSAIGLLFPRSGLWDRRDVDKIDRSCRCRAVSATPRKPDGHSRDCRQRQ